MEGSRRIGGCKGSLPTHPDAIDKFETFGEPTIAGKGATGGETTSRRG